MLQLQKIIFPPKFDDTVELYFRAPGAVAFDASWGLDFTQQVFSFDTYIAFG